MTAVRSIVALALIAMSAAARADNSAELAKLRAMDERLAAVAYRLTTANAALCRERMPGTGIALHALDQYAPALRADARRAFGFETPVAIAAVAPESPAARAGVRAGDALVTIGDVAVSTNGAVEQQATSATRDAAFALLEAQPATVRLGVRQDGVTRVANVASVPACRAAFEVVIAPRLFAQADEQTIQLSTAHFEAYDDDGIAVTAAHELAHTILRHRARLEAAGAKRGLAAKFGRDRRLTRRVEDEADLLGVYLLRNAGYDPAIAVAFWRARVKSGRAGLLGHRTHAPPAERAAAIAAEIDRLPRNSPEPLIPAILSVRDQPLDQ